MKTRMLAVLPLAAALAATAAGARSPAETELCLHLGLGDLAEFRAGLAASPRTDFDCGRGKTLLHEAVDGLSVIGSTEPLRALLDRGAAVNARDDDGDTPLNLAALLAAGAGRDQYGLAARMLIDAGADVNAANKDGTTPLLRALEGDDRPLADLLIEKGANKRAKAAGGQSIFMAAANAGYEDLVQDLLINSTEGINDQDNRYGLTALMMAANQGHLEVVRTLLINGADPLLKSRAGQTARLFALTRGHEDVMRLLTQYETVLSGKPAAQAGVSREDVEAIVAKSEGKAPAAPAPDSDVDAPSYSAPADTQAYAVIVGIEHYEDLPEARFAERDAEAVKAHLRALGVPERNLILLTGAKATKAGLIKTLETWLPNNAGPGSRVFFYYSGHGAPDPASGDAYLVPADGDPQYLADTAYPLKRLYAKLNALKSRSTLAVLDSCFSGAGGRSVLAKGLRPLVMKIDTGTGEAGRVAALTASQASEVSGVAEEQGHGLFTYYFLRGLNGAAKGPDGTVTLGGLYDYLLAQVRDRARRDNRAQTPQLLRPDGEDERLR